MLKVAESSNSSSIVHVSTDPRGRGETNAFTARVEIFLPQLLRASVTADHSVTLPHESRIAGSPLRLKKNTAVHSVRANTSCSRHRIRRPARGCCESAMVLHRGSCGTRRTNRVDMSSAEYRFERFFVSLPGCRACTHSPNSKKASLNRRNCGRSHAVGPHVQAQSACGVEPIPLGTKS